MALVSDCPKNKTEISKASKRLNCGNDSFGNNQYICLPNEEKTSLVELCFDGIIGLNERGSCLEESSGKVIQHNCSRFLYGCPDSAFDTNEVYKYPACLKINKEYRCYVSDPFCQPIEQSKETDTNYEAIIYPCIGVLVAVGIIAVICLYLRNKLQRRLNCKEEPQKEEETPLQKPESPKQETPLQKPESPKQETPLQKPESPKQGPSLPETLTPTQETPLQKPESPKQGPSLPQTRPPTQDASISVQPRRNSGPSLPQTRPPTQDASMSMQLPRNSDGSMSGQLPGITGPSLPQTRPPTQDASMSVQLPRNSETQFSLHQPPPPPPPSYSDTQFSWHQPPPPRYSVVDEKTIPLSKKGKPKEVSEEISETDSDFCDERPDSELLLDFLSNELQKNQFSNFLAHLRNLRIHGTESASVNNPENCFKVLHGWYCKNHEMNHMTELKKALRDAQMSNLVDKMENFSKAKILFNPNKIKQPETEATTADIAFLANNVGGQYRRVLRFLDIKQNEIEQAEAENEKVFDRVYQPLVTKLPKLTRQTVCNAFHYVHLNNKIDDLNSKWSP